jgi:hypothetical protein
MNRGDKIICIKEDEVYKINQIYEIEFNEDNHVILKDHKFIDAIPIYRYETFDNTSELFENRFMLYNDWLALEREKQIKDILDDNNNGLSL